MPGRSGLLALSLLAVAGLAAPASAQSEPPAAPAATTPAKPAAARPATKPPAKSAKAAPAPAAPAAPLTPEEAERQAYKQCLASDLVRVQTTLGKQQTELAAEQNKLKQLYSEMMEAVSKSDSEPAPAASPGGAGGPNAKKEMSPAVKASVSYEAQTYKVQVARQAVLSSQKEALRLQGFLQHISQ